MPKKNTQTQKMTPADALTNKNLRRPKQERYDPYNEDDVKQSFRNRVQSIPIIAYYGQWRHLTQLLFLAIQEGCPDETRVRLTLSRIVHWLHFDEPRANHPLGYFWDTGLVAYRRMTKEERKRLTKDEPWQFYTGVLATSDEWDVLCRAVKWMEEKGYFTRYHHLTPKARLADVFDTCVAAVLREDWKRTDMRPSISAQTALSWWLAGEVLPDQKSPEDEDEDAGEEGEGKEQDEPLKKAS